MQSAMQSTMPCTQTSIIPPSKPGCQMVDIPFELEVTPSCYENTQHRKVAGMYRLRGYSVGMGDIRQPFFIIMYTVSHRPLAHDDVLLWQRRMISGHHYLKSINKEFNVILALPLFIVVVVIFDSVHSPGSVRCCHPPRPIHPATHPPIKHIPPTPPTLLGVPFTVRKTHWRDIISSIRIQLGSSSSPRRLRVRARREVMTVKRGGSRPTLAGCIVFCLGKNHRDDIVSEDE